MSLLVDLVRDDFGISGRGRWWRSDVHSSLVVDSVNDLFFFNARGLRGNAVDYLIHIRGFTKDKASHFIKMAPAGMPEEVSEKSLQVRFDKLVDLFHGAGRSTRDYWYRRLLTDSTIDRYRLGHFDGWNLIPIYDNGLFFNFQCRRDEPTKKIKLWYQDADFTPVLFNKDILKFVDTVYITEGMVDCLYLNQAGLPSVCSTNGSNAWNSGWIRNFTTVKTVFYIADNDKAGVVSAKSVAKSLGESRVRVLRFKDKREKYGALDFFKDGGTVDDFKMLLQEQSVYGFEKELM